MDNISLSVIIPVYNAENYLKKSISSYTFNKSKEVEFICVNDGSTDDSLPILKNFSSQDSRIKIIDGPNQGPAGARQLGITHAVGKYVWFVDSDDTCDVNAIDIILECIHENTADIYYFGVRLIEDSASPHPSANYYSLANIPLQRFDENLSLNKNAYLLFNLPRELWNKVYRRKMIIDNHITFPHNISLYDDIMFTTLALLNAKKIMLKSNIIYNYHLSHNGSVMDTAKDRLEGIFYYFKNIYKETDKYGSYIKRSWLLKEICSMNYWMKRKNINTEEFKKNLKSLYNELDINFNELMPNDLYQYKNLKIVLDFYK